MAWGGYVPASQSLRFAVFKMCTPPCSVDTARSAPAPRLEACEYAHAYGGDLTDAPSSSMGCTLKTSDPFEDTKDPRIDRVGTRLQELQLVHKNTRIGTYQEAVAKATMAQLAWKHSVSHGHCMISVMSAHMAAGTRRRSHHHHRRIFRAPPLLCPVASRVSGRRGSSSPRRVVYGLEW